MTLDWGGIVAAALGGAATGAMQSGVDDIVEKQKQDAIIQREEMLSKLKSARDLAQVPLMEKAKSDAKFATREQDAATLGTEVTARETAKGKADAEAPLTKQQIESNTRTSEHNKATQKQAEAQLEELKKQHGISNAHSAAALENSKGARADTVEARKDAAKLIADAKVESEQKKRDDKIESEQKKLDAKWVRQKDANGDITYFNEELGLTRYDKPSIKGDPGVDHDSGLRKLGIPLGAKKIDPTPDQPARVAYKNNSGVDVPYKETAPAKSAPAAAVSAPSLAEFLDKARAVNPGWSEAELRAQYKKQYGK